MSASQPAGDSSGRDEAVDLYARGVDTYQEPPVGLFATLGYLGPGLILVGSIVGSGELIMTTKLGAQAGFVLLWFVLLSCVIKTVVQAELARHVISSGQTILVMFNELPGPRGRRPVWLSLPWMGYVVFSSLVGLVFSTRPWANKLPVGIALAIGVPLSWVGAAWIIRSWWRRGISSGPGPAAPRPAVGWFIWLWLACQLVMFINGGAILGGAGQALQLMFPVFPETFGEHGARVWAAVIAVVCAALLLGGRYKTLERVSVGMVSVFTLITVVCTVLLQWTGNAITPADIREGFSIPTALGAGVLLTALAMYAGTGIGTWEMMHYTYWCVEKGYARNTGANQPGKAWPRRARGWIRVMYIDVLLTMAIFTISTICFYFLGAAILHPKGLDPSGTETLSILQNIFTGTLGSWAATLFVVGGFMVLFSTTFSAVAGSSRLMADGLCVMGIISGRDYHRRLRFIRFFIVFWLMMYTLTYWLLEDPPFMLIISSFVAVALYPPLGLGTLYLRYRGVDRRILPGAVTTGWLWICGLAVAVISPAAVLLYLAIRQGWLSL